MSTVVPLNVIRSVGRLADVTVMSAGGGEPVSQSSASTVSSSALTDSSSRVVSLDNVVHITSTTTATSGPQ